MDCSARLRDGKSDRLDRSQNPALIAAATFVPSDCGATFSPARESIGLGTIPMETSSFVRLLLESSGANWMHDRFYRFAILLLILLLAILVGQPYVDRLLFAATSPRPIAARS